jgi:hypothetical protein
MIGVDLRRDALNTTHPAKQSRETFHDLITPMPSPHPFHIQWSKTASCLGIQHAAKKLKAGV